MLLCLSGWSLPRRSRDHLPAVAYHESFPEYLSRALKKCDFPYYEASETNHRENLCLYNPRPEDRLCGARASADPDLGPGGADHLEQYRGRQLEQSQQLDTKPSSWRQ